MSMLAEIRRKQKVSLNPRGKWWTEDTNKFGQKMLEKMGWTKGKGLGANEQGMPEYSIKSIQKTCTAGIGYDENLEKWTEHHEKFNGILEQLQENQDIVQKKNKGDCSNKQSIELKSKESRARMHYHKFTRSKDINKYKLKDLANIFGQEELSSKIQTKIKKEINYEKEITETRNNWHGVVTINGGNMADYFKLKSNCKNITDQCKSNNITDNQAIDSESENEQHVGFGFVSNTENTLSFNYMDDNGISKDSSKKSNYAFDNPCLRLNSPVKTTSIDDSSKKSLKKKKKKGLEINNLNIDKINNETIDSRCSDFSSNNGISKDSNEKSNASDNPCLRLNSLTETTSTDGSSKKSSKKRKKELETDNLHTDENEHGRKKLKTIDSNCSDFSSSGISKDSNKSSNYAFDNPCLKLNNFTENTNIDDSSKKSLKKKKKKELESNDLNTNEINETTNNNLNDFSSSHGISKDSNEKSNYAFDNPCLRLNSLTETTSIDDSSKKSLKKKKKKLDINNLNTDEINETIDNNCNDFSSNRGPSKDSNENSSYAFDNPCLRLNSPVEITSIDGSSKKSLKKKKKELEINNLNVDEINEYETRKKLKIETTDSNCSDFSSNCEISKDFSENSNYAFDNPCLKLNSPMESTDGSFAKSLKKKKKLETNNSCTEINKYNIGKKLETIDSNCNGFTNPALDLNSDPKEDCNGKEFEISRAQFGLENCALDLTDEMCDKKRVTFNDQIMLYEYDKNSIKKKKGKHTLDKFEVENKKQKKKQKCVNITSSTDQEDTEKLAKKDKKHKKSKNKNVFNNENCFDPNMETAVNNVQQEKVENVKLTDIFPESCKVISVSDQSVGITDGSSNTKVRMSKKMLITLFHKNAILDFPGSNIHEIKGYGADIEC